MERMPELTILAKDDLALRTITYYRELSLHAGLIGHAREVQRAIDDFRQWRAENPGKCKSPDHVWGEPLNREEG